MNKKRIRQMSASLLRRVSTLPASRYLSQRREMLRELLEDQNYLQRFAPLYESGARLQCGDILQLCRDVMDQLSPEPEEGWIVFTYDFARKSMFPEPDFEPRQNKYGAGASFFLSLLQVLMDTERAKLPPDPMWTLELLEEDELQNSPHYDSYRLFLRSYRREYIYEMMRLGLEATPFRTLEHIAGVHYVALSVARDLKRAGVPIDLALVSGSAAGHDIGKFGCKPGERVPYLHYYYTGLWFRRRHMTDLGYVAANHSVWDLELDYLSVESLVLIYADFRVKQERGKDGREITKISTLAEAFDVILNKLDNVTEEKRTRYSFVYAKLRDFERYMLSLGVDTTLSGARGEPAAKKDVALMDTAEAEEALRLLGVEHNIALMNRLTGQRSFANLLELARSETDWRCLRAYLSVFESYSVYLSIPQKVQTLAFLYELLMHREGDIRRQAAALMGEIIARFHAGYAKEKPVGAPADPRAITDLDQWRLYLDKLIYPDRKLMQQHRRWISFTLKKVVNSLLEKCGPDRRGLFLNVFLRYYRRPDRLEDETAFQLLDTATALPVELLEDRQRYDLMGFAQSLAGREDITVRAAAVLLMDYIRPGLSTQDIILHALRDVECGDSRSLALLRQAAVENMTHQDMPLELDEDTVSEIFLDNLKTATPWIIKEINIRLLTGFAKRGGRLLHIATHLTNLVKVSDQVTVRHIAGNALLSIAPRLSPEERNEVAIELGRGLEIGQQEFSKYIPGYLGRFSLWLPPALLEELLRDLENGSLCSSNPRVVALALDTVGVIYEEYDTYRIRFPEEDGVYRRRRERLLGMLLKGLAGYHAEVRQEALFVLGRSVFGSQVLGVHEKRRAFLLMLKKILALTGEIPGDELTFYYRARMLGRLYRFLTEQEILYGGFQYEKPRPIAFFPGTFDPFTLSHKGIVQAIRDLGFEVMLAIDEFSWSKKTQPHRIRRRIVSMSIADEFHVHIFPENFPVNISSPETLAALREAFPSRGVAVVVGSDVVANASSYRLPPSPGSIHGFDHIIFRRSTGGPEEQHDYSAITGKTVELQLPTHLESISSTLIREAVDQGRDISNLIDPAAQEFIYLHGLYLREPQDKPLLQVEDLTFHRYLQLPDELPGKAALTGRHAGQGAEELYRELRRLNDQVLLLRHGDSGAALGFAGFRCLDSHQLFSRLGSAELSGLIRQHTGGRVLIISGIFVSKGPEQLDLCQLLLTEVLALALQQEYTYALFCPAEASIPAYVREILTLQGFVPTAVGGETRELMGVDMRRPIVLTRNVDTAIKSPFAANPRVLAAVAAAHRRLQRALTELYPGCLVLSMSAGIIYQRLLRKIAACNGVPIEPSEPRTLGECICVPFGKILRGVAVPNTVTKTLHTDKVYEPDLSRYSIEAYPFYPPLADQVRMIHAFERPVILVDDMLHDGKRIRRIAPLLEQTGTRVRQVLVGYLTGVGRDTMEVLGFPVDSVYYLPNLRMRFVESTLYPFIGGDTVRRTESMLGGLQPAVNRIFPYAAPDFTEDCVDGSTYHLSLCCLENARDILLALETEYRALYARNLTLSRLGEAVILPLCPDKGSCMSYDLNRAASTYLDNDIEMLKRLQAHIKIVIGES